MAMSKGSRCAAEGCGNARRRSLEAQHARARAPQAPSSSLRPDPELQRRAPGDLGGGEAQVVQEALERVLVPGLDFKARQHPPSVRTVVPVVEEAHVELPHGVKVKVYACAPHCDVRTPTIISRNLPLEMFQHETNWCIHFTMSR